MTTTQEFLSKPHSYDIDKKTVFKFSALFWKLNSTWFEVCLSNLLNVELRLNTIIKSSANGVRNNKYRGGGYSPCGHQLCLANPMFLLNISLIQPNKWTCNLPFCAVLVEQMLLAWNRQITASKLHNTGINSHFITKNNPLSHVQLKYF
jgi:hypothetical protein